MCSILKPYPACFVLIGILAGAPLAATVRTVGPHGELATVQAAIDAALADGGEQEIRVEGEGPSFEESLSIVSAAPGTRLALTGGWDASFEVQTDRQPTILGSGSLLPTLAVSLSGEGSRVVVDQFGLRGGPGGSLQVSAGATSNVVVTRSRFWGPTPAGGVAILLDCDACASLRFADNYIGESRDGDAAVAVGLIAAHARGGALELTGNIIAASRLTAGTSAAFSAVLEVEATAGGRAEVLDNRIDHNVVDGTSPSVRASAVVVASRGAGSQLVFDRNRVVDNLALGGGSTPQVLAVAADGGHTIVRSTLVAGDASGLALATSTGGVMDLGNLTVDAGEVGVGAPAGAANTSLFNSIVLAPQPLGRPRRVGGRLQSSRGRSSVRRPRGTRLSPRA